MNNSTWNFLNAKIDKLLNHKKQESNKKQTNNPLDFFLSKFGPVSGYQKIFFNVFHPPRKLNKISKTWLIIFQSYRKWTLIYSSVIIMKNRIKKNQWNEYFSRFQCYGTALYDIVCYKIIHYTMWCYPSIIHIYDTRLCICDISAIKLSARAVWQDWMASIWNAILSTYKVYELL